MKKDNKKALYESIMTSVAKEVKKALNEEINSINENLDINTKKEITNFIKDYLRTHLNLRVKTLSHYRELELELWLDGIKIDDVRLAIAQG